MEVSRTGLITRRILAYLLDSALTVLLWLVLSLAVGGFYHTDLAMMAIWNLYFLLSEYLLRGRTLGKTLCGLQVINGVGQAPSLLQVLIRSATRQIEAAISLITLLVCANSRRCQRVGDMLARTYVIPRKDLAQLRGLSTPLPVQP
ncbi:RDD family protein [Pseudomonas sp. Fl5BN2]|uniref:RDD family protein n=1 Tax=unclassified Pseudomonas TaxID=196821 RepID=UPI0013768256|nr:MULTISPECIES: RDD family protein [unclassified Pseudomonas]NBF04265.1 RDD family protein [Pseudomonas sp. Fl5BN2]NBF09850.1 RDD family protein [Pseudomonas sp. Fl4BN1]